MSQTIDVNQERPGRRQLDLKLVLAIVQKDDAGKLINALMERGFRATRIDATGGFLKRGNALIMMGLAESMVDEVLTVISSSCRTRKERVSFMSPAGEVSQMALPSHTEISVGGATVFVLGASRYERW